MPHFIPVAPTEAVPPGDVLGVMVSGVVIAIANVDGLLYAFESECTHSAGWLHEGILEGCTIACPMHYGLFDVRTGEALELPAALPVRTLQVRVADGWIEVERPG